MSCELLHGKLQPAQYLNNLVSQNKADVWNPQETRRVGIRQRSTEVEGYNRAVYFCLYISSYSNIHWELFMNNKVQTGD